MTNTAIDPLAIIELTNLKATGKLKDLARHSHLGTVPKWIDELVQEKDYEVRIALALNPAITHRRDIVQQLAKDKDVNVRYYLASNPAIACSRESVEHLAADEYSHVRFALARNPAAVACPEAIQRLAKDSVRDVRESLASNPELTSFPHEIINLLSKDRSGHVRYSLTYHWQAGMSLQKAPSCESLKPPGPLETNTSL